MFHRDEEPVAGLVPTPDGVASTWSVFLQTPDVAATVARATARGGRVLVEPMSVADLGTMAEVADPGGAPVGAWQPGAFAGFATRANENAPVWFETLSGAYVEVVAFYRDAFGWDTHVVSDTPSFRYTTLGRDENARAGIMDAAGFLGGQPSRWQFYVQVADADETVARAVATGGEIVVAPEDTPYGRIATIADPAGVRFCVTGPNLEAG
jgi:predicted enzyme related to lactoylglutathione lyase